MAWVDWYKSKRFKKCWRVRERTDGEIKTLAKGFISKKKANSYLLNYQNGAVSAEYDLPDTERSLKTLIEEFLKYCVDSGLKPATLNQYKYSLLSALQVYEEDAVLRNIPVFQLQTRHFERIKAKLLAGAVKNQNKKLDLGEKPAFKQRSVNGVKIILRTVRVLFNYAERMGSVARNACRKVDNLKKKPVAHRLTDEEVNLILGETGDFEFWEICMIAWKTGMRENEIINMLEVRRIWDRAIHFDPGETKRNKLGRKIPITDAIRFVEDRAAMVKSGQLYPGWSINRFKRKWSRLVGRVNRKLVDAKKPPFERLRFHDFKHTFISNWLSDGGKNGEVREITGNSLVSLQEYAHLEHSEVAEVANRIMQKRVGIRPNFVEQRVEQKFLAYPAISGNNRTSKTGALD